jgi:hypothetical protein
MSSSYIECLHQKWFLESLTIGQRQGVLLKALEYLYVDDMLTALVRSVSLYIYIYMYISAYRMYVTSQLKGTHES